MKIYSFAHAYEIVRTEAQADERNGRIWPNGIGFDWRGWEYSVVTGRWRAARKLNDGSAFLGYGESASTARAAAVLVKQ